MGRPQPSCSEGRLKGHWALPIWIKGKLHLDAHEFAHTWTMRPTCGMASESGCSMNAANVTGALIYTRRRLSRGTQPIDRQFCKCYGSLIFPQRL